MKLIPAVCALTVILGSLCLAQEPAPAAPAAPAAPPAPIAPARPVVEATKVTPDEAEKLIAETPGILILDVRTPEEFDHEHIKGAVNVNVFDAGFQDQVAALDQNKPVIVHCQSGRRSAEALMELAGKVKFPKVYHLPAGFKGWKDAKKPIEAKPLPGAGRVGPPGKKAPPAAK